MAPLHNNIDPSAVLPDWLNARTDDAAFLDELIQFFADCNSARDLAGCVTRLVVQNTNAENSSIMLLDGASGDLVTIGACSSDSRANEFRSSLTFKMGEAVAGWAASNNIPVRLADAPRDSRFLHSDSSHTLVRSIFVFPIQAGDRVIGVMNLSSPLPDAFGDQEERMAELVCRHIGKVLLKMSEFDRLRSKLIQLETLSSAGSLLAGIAHELNSPLTTILGFSDLMLQDHSGDNVRLATIQAEAARCVRITQNILKLGRRSSDTPELVSVHEAIRQTAELTSHQLRLRNITLVLDLDSIEARVWAHTGELTQVFLNLLTNAIQAIASTGRPGNIEISSVVNAGNLRISVVDDGPGIREHEIGNIFQPLYTTKEDGNGLGLNLSRNIVRSLGGEIHVSTNTRHGATFTVELPMVGEQDVASPSSEDRKPLPARYSVLVVDDEEEIVELVHAVATAHGLRSTWCTNGKDALALLDQNNFDLLICDYHMPGVGGRELLESIRKSGRGTRVLVLSGDVVLPETQNFVDQLGAKFLPKPFGVANLVAAIDQVLGL